MIKYLFSILLLYSNILRILTQKENDSNYSITNGLNKYYEIVNSCILKNINGEIKFKLSKLFDKNDNVNSFARISNASLSEELKELIKKCKHYGILKRIQIPSFVKNRTKITSSPCYDGFDYQTGNIVPKNSTICNKDHISSVEAHDYSVNKKTDFDLKYAIEREFARKKMEREIELEKESKKEIKLNRYLKKTKGNSVSNRRIIEYIRNLIKKQK